MRVLGDEARALAGRFSPRGEVLEAIAGWFASRAAVV